MVLGERVKQNKTGGGMEWNEMKYSEKRGR